MFVDRLLDLQAGKRGRGLFEAPGGRAALSPCYFAEAIGQLAGWIALPATAFRRRPIPGLASEVRISWVPTPEARLELEVEIESLDNDAIVYSGRATAGHLRVVELRHCVGPMLPLEDFDDPDIVRGQLADLLGSGARRRFTPGTLPPIEPVVTRREPGARVDARLRVPAWAPFFRDHFPRKPVLPATILLDAQIRLASELVLPAAAPGEGREARIRDLKMRAFIPPAAILELEAVVLANSPNVAEVALSARSSQRLLATARLEMSAPGRG